MGIINKAARSAALFIARGNVLEHHREAEADAVLGTATGVVVHAADVLNLEEAEDAADTGRDFPVGNAGVHDEAIVGEIHEDVAAGIFGQIGVVLVGESAPQHLDTDVFAQTGFLDEWDAIEDFTLHIPVEVDAPEAVVEEFHVGNEVERLFATEIGHVG